MAWSLMRFMWRLPKNHPTAATVISGIGGLALLIAAIGAFVSTLKLSTAVDQQVAVAVGSVALVVGLAITSLVAYAVVDTHTFRDWLRPNGTYGHAFVRWLGPIFLILAILEFLVALWIMTVVLEGMAQRE